MAGRDGEAEDEVPAMNLCNNRDTHEVIRRSRSLNITSDYFLSSWESITRKTGNIVQVNSKAPQLIQDLGQSGMLKRPISAHYALEMFTPSPTHPQPAPRPSDPSDPKSQHCLINISATKPPFPLKP